MVLTLPTILGDCHGFLLLIAMDFVILVMLLLNFGGLQVIAAPIAGFVGFHAIEIDVQTLQLFFQIDVAPTTAGYFVALMDSVAESLVQSDTPHMVGGADSDHWLFKRQLTLLLHLSFAQVYGGFISFSEEDDKHVAVMFHGNSKVAAALLTNDDFSLLLHGDVGFVGQEHVEDSGRLSTFIFGSLTRPPEAHYVSVSSHGYSCPLMLLSLGKLWRTHTHGVFKSKMKVPFILRGSIRVYILYTWFRE
ncbi:hypothetical protein ISN45_Aa07g007770 [Arabidopsis thaliana x Arabidopsis arenosa]|uniref:Uncharacterized protein n=1 Tax=Arabidopsis thaliana x Arabidopsis arenosa TaxID=1240361 RepID=A0A8T1Y2J0_9BRAS|nr:hypothetical protein ISN45_Aa07g007770 [Arabidopsis thaliana x Arabidopsis arenosa]